ncbi:Uncharacterised protein [uncultured archaeon]|nr:Uncharacterised protein [uncultured archaeon]
MRVMISLRDDANANAARYYSEAKKWRSKINGVSKGIAALEKKLAEKEKAGHGSGPGRLVLKEKRGRQWFEKFHWFFTSEGFLVISGRDAKSNELVVNRYMDPKDVYFHADIHGAGHTILKTDGKKPGEVSLMEAAQFAAVFSSAWRDSLPVIDVYSAKPEQVTKQAPTGESIGTGAFMVYGSRAWYKKTPLEFEIGCRKLAGDNGLAGFEFFSGPPSAVKSRADFSVRVEFGQDSKGDCAKKVAKIFSSRLAKGFGAGPGAVPKGHEINLDDIVSLLPSGSMKAVLLK